MGMHDSNHSSAYLAAAGELARAIDPAQLDAMARGLAAVRERGGRLFILGVGGGAGHASHAVNDFRKLCVIESYAPTDNVSELTARTNDDGWETSFSGVAGGLAAGAARRAARVLRRRRLARAAASRRTSCARSRPRTRSARRSTASSAPPAATLAQLADVAILIEPPAALRTPLVESFQARRLARPRLPPRAGRSSRATGSRSPPAPGP